MPAGQKLKALRNNRNITVREVERVLTVRHYEVHYFCRQGIKRENHILSL